MGTLASGSIDLNSLKVAGKPNKYITYVDSDNGIRVYDGTLSNGDQVNFVKINSNGMQIYKGGSADTNKVAEFGETITIGNLTNSHIEMDFNSLQFKEPPLEHSDGIYFSVSDLKDETGKLTYTDQELKMVNNDLKIRKFEPSVDTNYSLVIKKNGTVLPSSSYTIVSNDTAVNLNNNTVTEEDIITASYTTTDYKTKSFTFGYRNSQNTVGPMSIAMGNLVTASGESSGAFGEESGAHGKTSFAFGNGCTAKGYSSHAEGEGTYASGVCSHAEGRETEASGTYSHAEGLGSTAMGSGSHAEGIITRARTEGSHAEGKGTYAYESSSHAEGDGTSSEGYASHAEGVLTRAVGYASHAQNYRTIAYGEYQTAMGLLNITDYSNQYILILGNGKLSTTTPGTVDYYSNALTVDWNGNIISQGMAGQIIMYAGSAAPTGWLMCDGSAVSRTTYATLFAIIGTTYGSGDGSTTFNLPDFRGRVAVGVGTGTATGATAHTLGQKAGNEDAIVVLHNHTITDPGHTHTITTKYENDAASGTAKARPANNGSKTTSGSQTNSSNTTGITINNRGSSGTGANMMPYIGINYIICTGKTS